MLFNKNNRFRITEKQIKEEIKNSEGAVILRLNLRFPEIKCPKSDPMSKVAMGFYEKISKTFAQYAKGELFAAAENIYKSSKETFSPFSALMKYEITLDNTEILSVVTEFSVSNGTNPPYCQRQTQVWNRKNGTKHRFSQLFDTEKLKNKLDVILEKSQRRYFDKELFVLRENCVEFYLALNEGYKTLSIPKNELLKTPIQA